MNSFAKIAVFAAAAMIFVPAAHANTYQDQLTMLRNNFKASDKNGDGKLSEQEARDGGMTRVASNFARLDTDKDGHVTLAQLEAQMAARFE